MINFISRLFSFFKNFNYFFSKSDSVKLINGKILCDIQKQNKYLSINDNEFKIFSQFGEDGIIQYLTNNLSIKNKKFIEFGVENYEEANTRFLLENNNWSGLIIDSSKKNTDYIKKQSYYWRYNLSVTNKFLSIENINNIIKENHFNGNVGILSVDIDGNDYWILEAIDEVSADIIIVEYNANFGSEKSLTVKYDKNFQRGKKGISKLIYGCSLKAASKLCEKKGYSLVCTNSNGNNAFFVKNELLNEKIKSTTVEKAFNINSFKEYYDEDGNLTDITKKQIIEIQTSRLLIEV